MAVFLHCCLAIAMTQARLSQNPLTHNHEQTLRTGYRYSTAQISCTPSTAPANTTGRGQPRHSQAGLPGTTAMPLMLRPLHKATSSPATGAVGLQTHSPPTQHIPGAGSAGLSARGSSSELICASTRNAQNEKNVVPSSIGIPSPDINTTKDTSPPDFAAESVCVRLQNSRVTQLLQSEHFCSFS